MIKDIAEIHAMMGMHPAVKRLSKQDLAEFLQFRFRFLQEEVDEMRDASSAGDVVDALIDLVYVAVGTLDLFQVDTELAWDRVHAKNMLKAPGSNPNRPNRFGFPDMIKPEGWTPPNHDDNVGLLKGVYLC